MLIDVSIACTQDTDTGRSECSLLLEALFEYQHQLEINQEIYSGDTEQLISQISSIRQSISDAMLKTLESFKTLHVMDSKGNYKTVYVEQSKCLKEDADRLTNQLNTVGEAGAI